MKLIELMNSYIALKKSLGMKFKTERYLLLSFCDAMGDVDISDISREKVLTFFKDSGPSKYWYRRYYALNVFYRFAIGRGHVKTSPLPSFVPRRIDTFVPYIYTIDELKTLISRTHDVCSGRNCIVDAACLRLLILLLWGTGLRLSEALNLKVADVDVSSDLITVNETKFFKSRLVPIDPKLSALISQHISNRQAALYADSTAVFLSRRGNSLTADLVESYFRKLCTSAGIVSNEGDSKRQPRLHDLRHTFAVSRIVSWYRSGENVQRLLPHLSTYLGHTHLSHTQRYLRVTTEVLRLACNLFEQYAMEVDDAKH